MKLPESRRPQTKPVQRIFLKEGIKMKAMKFTSYSHLGSAVEEKRPYTSDCTTARLSKEYPGLFRNFKKTSPNHNLAITKDGLTLDDLYREKTVLENKKLKLEQDIAESQHTLKVLQQAIQTATRDFQAVSVSHLAAGLAHEIRNPLTTIKGFIQLLKPELQAAGQQEFAGVALDEINRANSLLTEFLSVLKPAPSEKKKLSINKLASSMFKLISSESILKDIEITSELPDDEFYVLANEYAIKQVLLNLLKNAIEAVEGNRSNKGIINLVVSGDGGFVHVSVIDNGSGIDEYSMKKIFTPFYSTKAEGTGMGLAISKQIIEDHGGEMSVTSQPCRTIFKFSLPAI
jgi:signal transduction histidine kinase